MRATASPTQAGIPAGPDTSNQGDPAVLRKWALAYFEAGRTVLAREVGEIRTVAEAMLNVPALHLVAHGVELVLKAGLLQAGAPVSQLASREFGHRLYKLWLDPRNAQLRARAVGLVESYRGMPEWPESIDMPEAVAERSIADHLLALEALHSGTFALRYGAKHGTLMPKPHLLLEVFETIAHTSGRGGEDSRVTSSE